MAHASLRLDFHTARRQSPPWTLSQTDSRRLTMRYGTAAAHSLRTVRSRRQPSSISPETGGSVRRLRAAPSRLDTRDRSLVDLQPPWHAPQSTPDPTSPNHITTCPWRGHKPTRRPRCSSRCVALTYKRAELRPVRSRWASSLIVLRPTPHGPHATFPAKRATPPRTPRIVHPSCRAHRGLLPSTGASRWPARVRRETAEQLTLTRG